MRLWMSSCDAADGVVEGLIQDPRKWQVRPRKSALLGWPTVQIVLTRGHRWHKGASMGEVPPLLMAQEGLLRFQQKRTCRSRRLGLLELPSFGAARRAGERPSPGAILHWSPLAVLHGQV